MRVFDELAEGVDVVFISHFGVNDQFVGVVDYRLDIVANQRFVAVGDQEAGVRIGQADLFGVGGRQLLLQRGVLVFPCF